MSGRSFSYKHVTGARSTAHSIRNMARTQFLRMNAIEDALVEQVQDIRNRSRHVDPVTSEDRGQLDSYLVRATTRTTPVELEEDIQNAERTVEHIDHLLDTHDPYVPDDVVFDAEQVIHEAYNHVAVAWFYLRHMNEAYQRVEQYVDDPFIDPAGSDPYGADWTLQELEQEYGDQYSTTKLAALVPETAVDDRHL